MVDARPVLGSSAAGGSDRESPELARAQRVGRKRAFQKRVCTYPLPRPHHRSYLTEVYIVI